MNLKYHMGSGGFRFSGVNAFCTDVRSEAHRKNANLKNTLVTCDFGDVGVEVAYLEPRLNIYKYIIHSDRTL